MDTRYEQLAAMYLAIVTLAVVAIWPDFADAS
jgi:hypothetical protein